MIQLNAALQTCLYFQAPNVRSKAAVMISILYHLLRLSVPQGADPAAETNKMRGHWIFGGGHTFVTCIYLPQAARWLGVASTVQPGYGSKFSSVHLF